MEATLNSFLSGVSQCWSFKMWTSMPTNFTECDPARLVVDALGGDKSHATPNPVAAGQTTMCPPPAQGLEDPVTGEASAMKAKTASKRRQASSSSGAMVEDFDQCGSKPRAASSEAARHRAVSLFRDCSAETVQQRECQNLQELTRTCQNQPDYSYRNGNGG